VLKGAIADSGLEVEVINSSCLEVCKMGPVVFYAGDRTWYTRVTPDVAKDIVQAHIIEGHKLKKHLYPKEA